MMKDRIQQEFAVVAEKEQNKHESKETTAHRLVAMFAKRVGRGSIGSIGSSSTLPPFAPGHTL
jgi:hypothetical protein